MVLGYEDSSKSTPMQVDSDKEIAVCAMADRQRVAAAETGELFACVRLKAPSDDESKTDRPQIKLSAVLDRSGSMSGPKLDLCKGSIKYAVKQMTAKDMFGLVTYDDSVKEEFPMALMTEENKQRCLDRIDRVKTGGCTNLEGGLFAGIKQASGAILASPVVVGNTHQADGDDHKWTVYVICANPAMVNKVEFKREGADDVTVYHGPFETSGVTWGVSTLRITVHYANGESKVYTHNLNFDKPRTERTVDNISAEAQKQDTPTAVWLFTDGLANSGKLYRDPPMLYQEVQNMCRGTNTLVSTFGYGEDHEPKMLRGICEAGRGQYNYIENEAIIPEAFGACLGGLLSVAATNIAATLIPMPGVKITKVISNFENQQDESGSTLIKIPDLYEEEQRDLIVTLQYSVLDAPKDNWPLLTVSATYHNNLTSKQGTCACTMVVDRPAVVTNPGINAELDVQKNRVNAAEAMKQARIKADANQLDQARDLLAKAKSAIVASPSAASPYCVDLVDDMVQCEAGMRSINEYRSKGSKVINCTEMGHWQQRGMNHSKPMQYATKKKAMHSAKCTSFATAGEE